MASPKTIETREIVTRKEEVYLRPCNADPDGSRAYRRRYKKLIASKKASSKV